MIEQGWRELTLVCPKVSRETYQRLIAFEAEFLRWAGKLNLVSPSTIPLLWPRHILDSAQLLGLLPDARRWVDVGTGGGFPGLVLALMLAETPDSSVTMIESNARKAGFLTAMVGHFGLRAKVLTERVERVVAETADVVTCRAVAELDQVFAMTHRWSARGAVGLFHKGEGFQAELDRARAGWSFEVAVHESSTAPGSAVLEIAALARRN